MKVKHKIEGKEMENKRATDCMWEEIPNREWLPSIKVRASIIATTIIWISIYYRWVIL